MPQTQREDLPTPPPLPAGWHAAPPDYVGVGTARSGTTWWDSLINAHPRVTRLTGTPKEIHFFDGLWQRAIDADDIERYHRFFAWPEGRISGEWTPGYMVDAWTPALLRAAAPEARLLVLLRDPVERFRSGRTLAENRFTVGSTARAAANAAFNRGVYADQLLRLWNHFPREQVLVLQYERCVAEPAAELERTYAFIGLEPAVPDGIELGGRVNASRGPKVGLSEWQEDQLVRRYAPENERLAIHAHYLDDGRPGDAAAVLGISKSGYYKLLERARRRLASMMNEVHGHD